MRKQLSPEQRALYEHIDTVLWEMWDPIGMNDNDEARDEYDQYVPPVFSLAIKGASPKEIADYLREIEVVQMGMHGGGERVREHRKAVAKAICQARDNIIGLS